MVVRVDDKKNLVAEIKQACHKYKQEMSAKTQTFQYKPYGGGETASASVSSASAI